MREKLLELLKREGLKPSQLAEILEINPAGISHILAGRNKPSFELLQKILRRFPRINPDWLLLDSDQIYRSDFGTGTSTSEHPAAAGQSAEVRTADNSLFGNLAESQVGTSSSDGKPQVSTNGERPGPGTRQVAGLPTKAGVQRIVIFYDDQTFECYFPTNR